MPLPDTRIDTTWWNGLSDEWKTILLINQQFSKQQVDFVALQEEYINRLQLPGEARYSPLNTSLYDLNDKKRYSLGYLDFYKRAVRMEGMTAADSIDLESLGRLDKIYMVNGPADLAPLIKFTGLKVLIMNSCGIDVNDPVSNRKVDLAPLRYLNSLQVLQCAFTPIKSLEPIRGLVNLIDLDMENSGPVDLIYIKNLVKLEKLTCGPATKNDAAIGRLPALKELYWKSCPKFPPITSCRQLQKLSISESEMAIVHAGYRFTDIDQLKPR